VQPRVDRAQFPALQADPGLCYLDSAATTLVPAVALAALTEAVAVGGSAGRSGHRLGAAATASLAAARAQLAASMAVQADELVITASATDGLLLAAQGAVAPSLRPGDRLIVGRDAHHAQLLPWRALAEQAGAELVTVGLTDRGELDRGQLAAALSPRVRAVALTHVSNVTGAVLPVARIAEAVRAVAPRAWVVVDGTQALSHLEVRPAALRVDLYVWSAHKAYGALGAGFVWGPAARWPEVRPVRWGGGMVTTVADDGVELRDAPVRFEAGTLNHPAVVCAAAGMDFLAAHRDPAASAALATEAAQRLAAEPGVAVLGAPAQRTGLVSFVVDGVHPHDVAQVAEAEGVAVRAGHHCAQPLLRALGQRAAVRASFGLHSGSDDVQRLVAAVARARRVMGAA